MKSFSKFQSVVFLSLLLFSVSTPVMGQEASAQSSLEMFIETLRAMQFPVMDTVRHDELVKKADSFLDLNSVGKRAIAEHWDQASEEQQKKFLSLFSKLIGKTAYPRSHDFLGNLKITYKEAVADASGASIHSVVHDASQGLDTEVIYHLTQKDGNWIVDDVVLDEVSIIEDLKYQFDKIVRDSSFDGLLTKMQERLEQPLQKS